MSAPSQRLALTFLLGCACLLCFARLHAQDIQLGDLGQEKPAPSQRVSFDPDPITVAAGKPEWIELRFHVTPGFHINAHVPHDELLIPTSLNLADSATYRLLGEEYPAGTPLWLDIGAGETLTTYTGAFRLRLHVLAKAGESSLRGTLHYQACDTASCFPPRDLALSVPLRAR